MTALIPTRRISPTAFLNSPTPALYAHPALLETRPIDVGIDDVGHLVHRRVVEVEDLLESGVQNLADVEQEEDGHDRQERRHGDADRLLKTIGPVDRSRLVQAGVDGGECRQIDDRAPPHALPDSRDHQHAAKGWLVGEPAHRLQSRQREKVSDGPALCGEDLDEDPRQHDPGDEVREVGERLHRLLVGDRPDLVEQQRQDDRGRKAEDDPVHADDDRVSGDPVEERILEEPLEVLEVIPGTAVDAPGDAEVLEGDADPVHGKVFEYDQENDRDQEQDVVLVHPLGPVEGLPADDLPDIPVRERGHRDLPTVTKGERCRHRSPDCRLLRR